MTDELLPETGYHDISSSFVLVFWHLFISLSPTSLDSLGQFRSNVFLYNPIMTSEYNSSV